MAETRRPKHLITEALVIVASILFAFWIDAWWEDRGAKVAEAGALEAIRTELAQNREALDAILTTNEDDLDRIDRFVRSTPSGLLELPADSVRLWLGAISISWTFDGDLSATNLFLDAGAPVTDRGRQVRAAAAEWARLLDDAEEEASTLWELGQELSAALSTVALEASPAGLDFVNVMASRVGPEGISRLRGDQAFMPLVLNKAHFQRIYIFELDMASQALDSLRAELR